MDDTKRTVPPSEKAALEQQKIKEMEARQADRVAMLREDFTRTFRTQHGKRVLQWFRQRCGHNKIILSANRQDGTIDQMMTTFAAMELNLYLTMREYLPTEILKEIEHDGTIEPSGTIREPRTGRTLERTSTRRKRSTTE